MKVCEICGMEEQAENEVEIEQTRRLHVCEGCRSDRRFPAQEEIL